MCARPWDWMEAVEREMLRRRLVCGERFLYVHAVVLVWGVVGIVVGEEE